MMIKLRASLTALVLVVACSVPAFSETILCTQCGMMVTMASKFTAKIVQGDTPLYFCDIGDFFSYVIKKGEKEARSEVKDYDTGEWIDAKKAYYVHDEKKFKTPMGSGASQRLKTGKTQRRSEAPQIMMPPQRL